MTLIEFFRVISLRIDDRRISRFIKKKKGNEEAISNNSCLVIHNVIYAYIYITENEIDSRLTERSERREAASSNGGGATGPGTKYDDAVNVEQGLP